MPNKTTIYDIAKKLNITAATISRALNDHPRISEATKQLVLETAKEMNYEPNRMAIALKSGKSNNVGVVVPYINGNFFSTAIRGIEEGLFPKGYNVIICQTHESEEREVKLINNLMKSHVEGIIISLSRFTKNTNHFTQVIKSKIPLIFFDRKISLEGSSSVTIDDYQGGYDATKHLIDNGCTRIAHLSVDSSLEIYKRRFEGYKAALEDHNIPFYPQLVLYSQSNMEEGKRVAKSLMSQKIKSDAIFSASDYVALGAIKWLKQNGYTIPKDIRVVGFGDEPFTQFMELSISSVDQYPFEMGKKAAEVFLKQVKSNGKSIQENLVLKPELIIRKSS
jgi:LacI family transcriptional regulator